MTDVEQNVRKCLDQALDQLGYSEREVQLESIDGEGSNFTGSLYRITVTSPNEPTLHLFAKTSNMAVSLRDNPEFGYMYEVEYKFYTKMLKSFEEIYARHSIPEEQRLVFPKYYGALIEREAEVLILEDLAKARYRTFDRFKPVDWEHAAVAMATLSKFHALGFAVKKEDPDIFNEFQENKQITVILEQLSAKSRQGIQEFVANIQEEYRDRVAAFLQSSKETVEMVLKADKSGPLTVIHGDFRISNMMVKRQNGKLVAMPLDFQAVHTGNVVFDLYFFIAMNTDENFRKYYQAQMLDFYYAELTRNLLGFGIDVKDVYPREVYEENQRVLLPYYLILALAVLPLVLVERENVPDFASSEEAMDNFKIVVSPAFKTRITGILRELDQKGVF